MSAPLLTYSPEPIYVLGDSHSETFAMRCYDVGERRFIFRAIYIPYAQAQFFEAKRNKLSRHLLAALTRAGLAVAVTPTEIGMLHTTNDPHWQHIAIVRAIPHADPPIAFSIGAIDLLQFSCGALEAFDDITMDGESPTASAIRYAEAAELFYLKMKPFADALRTLQSQGFSRLSVLSLVPFSSIDGQFAAACENLRAPQSALHLAPLWRSKLIHIGNATLARIAQEAGIPFIDRGVDWNGTGLAGPGLLIDGIHLDADPRDRSAIAIINAVGRIADTFEPPARPSMYQVKFDAGTTNGSLSEITIAEESFVAIQDTGSGALCRLRDVNTGDVVWMNRARIISVVPIT